jgi:hypothetical protein
MAHLYLRIEEPTMTQRPYKRTDLSGMRLDMMTPGIEFGISATVQVFANMYDAASKLDPNSTVFEVNRSEVITAGDILQAFDTYFPEENGRRQISGHLNFDDSTLIEGARRPLEVMARIQSHVWMKFDDELPDLLSEKPKDIWHAIQYMEYQSCYNPVDPDAPTEVFAAGTVVFEKTGDRIRIHNLAGKPEGDLLEMKSTTAVLPQYYADLDDGSIRNLNNDNYSIVEVEIEEPEADDDTSLEM